MAGGQTTTPTTPHVIHKLHVVPESVVGEVHVNVLTYFLINGLDSFWGKVDSLAACLGFNNPVKIAWNNAKMTWLLEYFVNVGPTLDKLAAQPFKDGKIEVRSAWHSTKIQFLVEVYRGRLLPPYDDGGTPTFDPTPVGKFLVKQYSRNPGLVLTEEELVSCDLSDQQKLILLALAESRLHWDRTPWTKWAIRKWGPWADGAKPRLRFKTPPWSFIKRFRH